MMKSFFFLLVPMVLFSCEYEGRHAPKILGMDYSQSNQGVSKTIELLEKSIEENPNLRVLAKYEKPELNIAVAYFGNPLVGTELMLENQLVGIDLPQRMLSFSDGLGGSYLAYNSGDFLANAYGLKSNPKIKTLNKVLPQLNSSVTGTEIKSTKASNFRSGKGVSRVSSKQNFRSTYELVLHGIKTNDYEVFLELDHGENARKKQSSTPEYQANNG